MNYVFTAISIFLISFSIANAQVAITEVMYDVEGSDSGREWIEVTNTSASAIDISTWKFFENGTNHGLTLVAGDANMQSGASFIVADNTDKFFIDNPSFSGNVFDSSFSLKNTGELIAIRDAELNDIDVLTYDPEVGADGDGNSLQLVSSSWIASTPTAGSASVDIESSEEEQVESESQEVQQSSSSSSSSTASFPVEQQIFVDAGGDRNVIVGADSLFEGRALGLQKKPLENARYVWNFGNGETKEGQNVLHYYGYPGEYVVMLNVTSGEYSASDRVVVNAYPAEIVFSKIESNFVEIHNKSNKELNLSWWQIQSAEERFMIPKDTIILANKKLIFSSDITGLDTSIKENVSLLYPNGVEAVIFEQIKIPQKTVVVKKTVIAGKGLSSGSEEGGNVSSSPDGGETLRSVTNLKKEEQVIEGQKEIIKNTAQTASVISSLGERGKDSNIYKWLLAIFVVIGISVGIMVYASKKEEKELGDDIEIVE
jgi:hypothetical protein